MKDTELVKELGRGRGQVRVIQQLLDQVRDFLANQQPPEVQLSPVVFIDNQGADPSCCSRDGQHALAVAVVNGHHDVLPVLLQRGADVNQQFGQ